MKTIVVKGRSGKAVSDKQLRLRDSLWPEAPHCIWDRKVERGFATIPKTMPLILKIMDEMTKGAPVSSTYLTLWCCTWDNGFASLANRAAMVNASGFGGQRGDYTWVRRMRALEEFRFIDIKPGKHGPMTNAIIWNPHLVIRWHRKQKTPGLVEASYNALLEWALDIGAKDMTDERPEPEGGAFPWEFPRGARMPPDA